MRRVFATAALVFCFASPALASLDSASRNLHLRNADGIVPGPIRLAQSSLAVIDAPTRIDTDQETVDFNGRTVAPGEITLTVNGAPVAVAPDGSFRIRQPVPVGRTRFLLVLQGSYGDTAEHRVFVHRSAAAAEPLLDDGDFRVLVFDKENVTTNRNLHEAMQAIYKRAGIYKREGGLAGGVSQALIESFGEISIVRVDDNVLTLKVSFRWSLDDSQKSGSANGIFTVETDGTSYKVLKLETGGKTY